MRPKNRKLSTRQKWLRGFFMVAGNIAPETTIRILVRLLFTPKRLPLKPAHIECLHQAEKFEFEVGEFQNPEKKLKLAFYSWGKGTKIILLVHGWDARALDFYRMIPELVAAGYQVLAFDGPAHGKSEGEKSNLIDFKEVVNQVSLRLEKPYGIIGHSMGGAAATFALMDFDIAVEKLITIAIPIVSRRFFDEVFSVMKVPRKMREAFFKGYKQEMGDSIDRYDLLQRTDKIKARDMLMIYDENDEIVNSKDVKQFLSHHPEVKQVNAKDAGHYRIIRDKNVIKEVVAFLNT
jgi:alpha-beta hydrolase superfamily lysophospholipase